MGSNSSTDDTPPRSTEDAARRKRMSRVAIASSVGTTIEWYDFFLYGTMAALVFSELFFTKLDSATGTIASLATFAAGFLARPIGGIAFGYFGDRMGRKASLIASLSLMGVSTFLIGIMPTYTSIGVLAPVLLSVLRLLQGFALGGEWAGAAALATEHADDRRRGFYGGWVQIGSSAGSVLATATVLLLTTVLDQESFLAWGWRVPFLFSAVLVVVGMFIRLKVEETPVFQQMQREGRTNRRIPLAAVLQRQWRTVLLVIGMHLANTTIAYLTGVFLLAYGTTHIGMESSTILLAKFTSGLLLMSLVSMPAAALGDRIGRRPVYLAGTIGLIVTAFPAFWLFDTGSFPLALLAILLLGLANVLMYQTQGAFFTEIFDPEVRCTGAALGVQVATVIGGGTAPIIATWLIGFGDGRSWPVAVYLIFIGLVSTVCTLLVKESRPVPTAQRPETLAKDTVAP
ncbi:MFS transporter [Streptomyces sp. B-S-A8]|uniref:MFS transporter n=1 Tax=Streptomyces solicavernae TaxID=3043614 RepID=A0ABT6RT86_9ACTN|nr:MFS transporter [Streptomyces sp. B-S-A8]MDI3387642.1 MFS transporter [Streptomyces sp. B-S-A8]